VYAVIQAGGHQYRVKAGDKLTIDRQSGEEGGNIKFDKVLLLGGDKLVAGAPYVEGASVDAVIKQHGRAKKVTIFKFKRRKNYKRTRGHKQPQTEIEIKAINS